MVRLTALALAALLLSPQPASALQAADLKSKDPAVRVEAVRALVAAGGADAEKELVRALKDDDWEVVVVAASGLATLGGGKASLGELCKLAWDAPTARQRLTAARSLAQLDPEAGMKAVSKKLSGDRAPKVCDALVVLAAAAPAPKAPKALSKLLKDKEPRTRDAAARALVVCSREDRAEALERLLESEYLGVRAAALEAVALDPRGGELATISQLLERAPLPDVIERRALRAMVAACSVLEEGTRSSELGARVGQLSAATEAARAELGPRLALEGISREWADAAALSSALAPAVEHPAEAVRAGAARALGELGPEQLELLQRLATKDTSPRVRRAALAALHRIQPPAEASASWWIERLESEQHPAVRMDLAVALGVRELEQVVPALAQASRDSDALVAQCAMVSLGRTRTEAAVAPLVELSRDPSSWARRGAAVVGLCSSFQAAAIPAVIEALADAEPLVGRTAHGFLLRLSKGKDLPAEVQPWRDWWRDNEKRVRFLDPKELAAERERLGYSASPEEVYRGLDVLVLESRGDHIQNILSELAIAHRLTTSSRVPEDGVDGAGVFVSNCTGEMEAADVARLEWFVSVGGYLFGSCWAVHETIERATPGRVRKLETRDEVLDKVLATPWAAGSPYLEGVFLPDVRPIYSLFGAHLIEVLEPEAVEVLVDSPECAERWGGGNLACWFSFGHGKVLDSVNHFDLQGLEEATWLKTPEDRMAYAVDHMGTSFERIRATAKEKFWDSNTKASKEVRDLSVFKLVTNFVRLRRLEGL